MRSTSRSDTPDVAPLSGTTRSGRIPVQTAAPHHGLTPLWTIAEVADYLRVNEKTIRRWINSQGLPCLRLGGRLRFNGSDILRWTSARQEGG